MVLVSLLFTRCLLNKRNTPQGVFLPKTNFLEGKCLLQEERKQARLWSCDLLVIQGGRRNDVLFRAEQGCCKDLSEN